VKLWKGLEVAFTPQRKPCESLVILAEKLLQIETMSIVSAGQLQNRQFQSAWFPKIIFPGAGFPF
jgi:hypothetical protein